MNLEKATETLVTFEKGEEAVESNDLHSAIKLLIEAGKLIKEKRGYPEYIIPNLLPGETKD